MSRSQTKEEEPVILIPPSISGIRILLVDDNDLSREIAAELLNMHDFIVEQAVDGVEAVNCFLDHEEGYYAAILMDVRMPVMDGYEAARTIRKSIRGDALQIPIVAMTANSYPSDRQKAMEAGMSQFIEKPLNMKFLCGFLKGNRSKDIKKLM